MVKVMEFVFQLSVLRPRVLPPSRLQPGWKPKQQLRSNPSSPDLQGEIRLLWWEAEINACVFDS